MSCSLFLRYISTAQEPTGSQRQVTFIVNDGYFNSTPATAHISIIAVNDPPLMTLGQNGSIDTVVVYNEGQLEPLMLAPLLVIYGKQELIIDIILIHIYIYILMYTHSCVYGQTICLHLNTDISFLTS